MYKQIVNLFSALSSPVVSEAEPHRKLNLINFCGKIWHLLTTNKLLGGGPLSKILGEWAQEPHRIDADRPRPRWPTPSRYATISAISRLRAGHAWLWFIDLTFDFVTSEVYHSAVLYMRLNKWPADQVWSHMTVNNTAVHLYCVYEYDICGVRTILTSWGRTFGQKSHLPPATTYYDIFIMLKYVIYNLWHHTLSKITENSGKYCGAKRYFFRATSTLQANGPVAPWFRHL